MKKVIITLAVVAIVGMAIFVLSENSNSTDTSTPNSATNTTTNTSEQEQSSTTITYDGNGFSPAQLTVDGGATVTISNTSAKNLQLNSVPHPVHTDNTELNVGVVSAGQSKTFTVTTKGTFGYHDHLNPSDTGTIIVQ